MRILRPLLIAIVGGFLLFGGFTTLNSGDEVKCGSRVMGPGDTCEETKRGHTVTTRSYDEQRDDNKSTGWVLLGIGGLMALGGGIWFIATLASGPGQRQPAPQQYPPNPYPQQG